MLGLAALLAMMQAGAADGATGTPSRPFTVLDSIGMTRVVDPTSLVRSSLTTAPDGKQFLMVVRRGNLSTGLAEYRLLRFQEEQILGLIDAAPTSKLPQPEVLAEFATGAAAHAIADVQWLPDNRRVRFIGRGADGVAQAYTLDIQTRQLRQLTHHQHSVGTFDIASGAPLILFAAEVPRDWTERNKHGYVVEETNISYLTTADPATVEPELGYFVENFETREVRRIALPEARKFRRYPSSTSLSPSGQWAVVNLERSTLPDSWQAYDFVNSRLQGIVGAARTESGRAEKEPGFGSDLAWLTQLNLVNVATGKVIPLIDAPSAASDVKVWWSSDNKSVVIAETLLPPGTGGSARNAKFITQVMVDTGELIRVAPIDEGEKSGLATQRRLISRSSDGDLLVQVDEYEKGRWKSTAQERFHQKGKRWFATRLSGQKGNEPARIAFEFVQDIDSPPELKAVDRRSGRSRVITDLNPRFRAIDLGRGENIRWTDRRGQTVEAGLLLPSAYQATQRYPLVIQTYGFIPGSFLVDGASPNSVGTAFSARALAGKGMVVLQMFCRGALPAAQLRYEDGELPRTTECVEDAIDELDRRGIIDRQRVGVIGFSRTGLQMMHTVTFSKYPIAAATIADAAQSTPWFYAMSYGYGWPGMAELDRPRTETGLSPIGAPFWGEGIKLWVERSTVFNLHRIRTPIRFEHIGTTPPTAWDIYTILRRNSRPAEMIHIPKDVHSLMTPSGQYTSHQGTVDWFAFWLKGEEDPAAEKAEQYRRWRELRAQHVAHLRERDSQGSSPSPGSVH